MFRATRIAIAAISSLIALPVHGAVVVSVEAAGVTAPTLSGYNYSVATLDNAVNGLPTVAFAGSSITGTTTSGFVNIAGANTYGGVGASGAYGSVNGDPAMIQLSESVNYFGLWGSALDGNNSVELYDNDILLGSFALQSVLQTSSGFNSGYYDNQYVGGNSGELYAFFNFTSDTSFNRVQLVQNGGGGFEFDNLTVGSRVVSTAPEAGTWAMMLLGFAAIGAALRQRRSALLNPRVAKPSPAARQGRRNRRSS